MMPTSLTLPMFAALVLDLEETLALPASYRIALARALAERIRAVDWFAAGEADQARELIARLAALGAVEVSCASDVRLPRPAR